MLHLEKAVRFLATACILQCTPSSYVYSITPSEVISWVDEQKQCLQERMGTGHTIEIFNFADKNHLYAYKKLSGTLSSPAPFEDRINHFIAPSKLFLHIKTQTLPPISLCATIEFLDI